MERCGLGIVAASQFTSEVVGAARELCELEMTSEFAGREKQEGEEAAGAGCFLQSRAVISGDLEVGQLRGEALYSCSDPDSSAVELGEGRVGNVGQGSGSVAARRGIRLIRMIYSSPRWMIAIRGGRSPARRDDRQVVCFLDRA